jgi:pyruvate formate lyase activating enzyme
MYLRRISEILWTRKGDKVTCLLCPHYCAITEGKTGLCRTRTNKDGVLFSLAYGNPCSVAIDPVEKKPLYHFLPGSQVLSIATAGCNFRCLNCQNWTISQASPENIDHYDLSPGQIINMALRHKTPSIAFTYTEPTVFYEYMFDIAVKAKDHGLKTIMVSNGYINTAPLEALCPYIDATNIDLKCFDDKMYRRLTGGRLQPVLNTLLTLQKAGVWTEITHLVIPEMTDNMKWFEAMCLWLVDHGFASTPLHISRFFPTHKLPHLPPTPVEQIIRAKETAEKSGLRFVYPRNI